MTHDEYQQFSTDGMIYLCPHCSGKKADGSYDWAVFLNRYVE